MYIRVFQENMFLKKKKWLNPYLGVGLKEFKRIFDFDKGAQAISVLIIFTLWIFTFPDRDLRSEGWVKSVLYIQQWVHLRVKFHKSLFSVRTYFGCWGSLLDPYFKKVGPYFKAWGSLLVSGTVNMEMTRHHHEMKSLGMALLDYCTNG